MQSGVADPAYKRWRKKHRGLKLIHAKQLKEL